MPEQSATVFEESNTLIEESATVFEESNTLIEKSNTLIEESETGLDSSDQQMIYHHSTLPGWTTVTSTSRRGNHKYISRSHRHFRLTAQRFNLTGRSLDPILPHLTRRTTL